MAVLLHRLPSDVATNLPVLVEPERNMHRELVPNYMSTGLVENQNVPTVALDRSNVLWFGICLLSKQT